MQGAAVVSFGSGGPARNAGPSGKAGAEPGRQDGEKHGDGGAARQRMIGQRLQQGAVCLPRHAGNRADVALHAAPGRAEMPGHVGIEPLGDQQQALRLPRGQGDRVGGLGEAGIIGGDAQPAEQGADPGGVRVRTPLKKCSLTADDGASPPLEWCTASAEMVHGGRGRGAPGRHAGDYSGMPLRLRMDSPSIWMV